MRRQEYIQFIKDKDIVLFGAGDNAIRFYMDFNHILHICQCISNDRKQDIFQIKGKKICNIERVTGFRVSNSQFVIICSKSVIEMQEQLTDMGYLYGKDYLDSEIFRLLISNKKIALFYGVCYIRALRDCLIQSSKFSECYETRYFLSYLKRDHIEHSLFLVLLEICDLFVYINHLSGMERRKTDQYLQRLSRNCCKISVPIITFNGFYPEYARRPVMENPYCIISAKTQYSPFSNSDAILNKMIDEEIPLNEIKTQLCDINYYKKDFLLENLRKEFLKISAMEKFSDLKIADFIMSNYKSNRLFLNGTHISNEIILEMAKRILYILNINESLDAEKIRGQSLLYTSEVPIYPSVIEHLELDAYDKNSTYSLFTFNGLKKVSFTEYIELYVDFCTTMRHYMEQGFFPKEEE